MKARSNNSVPDSSVLKRGPAYPKAVDRLIAEFARLPGIGRRTAERLAFYILKSDEPTALGLAQAVTDVKKTVRHCDVCYNLSDGPICDICNDANRERKVVLVVEQPKDLIALEQTGMFRGLYHVLMGRRSPLEGIGPDELTIARLMSRIDHPDTNPGGAAVAEVIAWAQSHHRRRWDGPVPGRAAAGQGCQGEPPGPRASHGVSA